MDKKEEKTPLQTLLGLRFLQILLIIFAFLLVKRCVALYHDNKLINDQIKIEYFEKGYDNGMKKAQGLKDAPEPQFKNYALKQAYQDGYRQGWDKGRGK